MKAAGQVFFLLALVSLLFAGCAGRARRRTEPPPETNSRPVNEQAPAVQEAVIINYRGKNAGAAVPAWVSAYLNGGAAAMEIMSEYQNVYVFVSENSGTAEVMEYWLARFNADRAFPRAAAARFRSRFIRDLVRAADEVYGRTYETAVKAAFTVRFEDVRKAADFWIVDKNGPNERRCFVLMLVGRETYEKQIQELLAKIGGDGSSREQYGAFSRVRDTFFDGF